MTRNLNDEEFSLKNCLKITLEFFATRTCIKNSRYVSNKFYSNKNVFNKNESKSQVWVFQTYSTIFRDIFFKLQSTWYTLFFSHKFITSLPFVCDELIQWWRNYYSCFQNPTLNYAFVDWSNFIDCKWTFFYVGGPAIRIWPISWIHADLNVLPTPGITCHFPKAGRSRHWLFEFKHQVLLGIYFCFNQVSGNKTHTCPSLRRVKSNCLPTLDSIIFT